MTLFTDETPTEKYISFIPKGRTGNNIFQYLACKLFELIHQPKYGYKYKSFETLHKPTDKNTSYYIYEDTFENAVLQSNIFGGGENKEVLYGVPFQIVCDGFFQKSHLFVLYRKPLLQLIYSNTSADDGWINIHGNREHIRSYLTGGLFPNIGVTDDGITDDDIVINLRLDDFIQLPNPTSDILPPHYYLEILENISFNKLYIVCDKIRHDWEHRYLDFFRKFNPTMVQGTLEEDCSVMRNCTATFIHSNSTLCWAMSFLGCEKKRRFIPKTFHYSGQSLDEINHLTDTVIQVKTLTHQEVYDINYENYCTDSIFPLPYCIPDECVVSASASASSPPKKQSIWATHYISQTGEHNYNFNHFQENEYNEMYRLSYFGKTERRGGWDCLRHYEIMANGCIPVFPSLEECPADTMISFPKKLVIDASRELQPDALDEIQYNLYRQNILEHLQEHCTVTSTARYFFQTLENRICQNNQKYYLCYSPTEKTPNKPVSFFPHYPKKVLLIRGDIGVNYSRELLWIGIKRIIREQTGGHCHAVEYPKIHYLYKSFYENDKKHIYGNGFSYSRRLEDDPTETTPDEIIEKTKMGYWDLIIYGKCGRDENAEGSLPHLPLWEHIYKKYPKNRIVCIYGGDCQTSLQDKNSPYYQHLLYHSHYATCFVRELKR